MSDTLLVLTEKGIYVLASKKKIDYLKPLESSKENEKYVPPINLLVRNKVCLNASFSSFSVTLVTERQGPGEL